MDESEIEIPVTNCGFDIEQQIQEMQEARKTENEKVRQYLLEELRKLKADELTSYYNAYGDSGNVEEISVVRVGKDADGNKLKEPVILLRDLETILENFIWSFAYAKSPGFENNEGGFGTLTWDLGTDTITLEHSNRYMETEDYVWEDL